MKIDPSANLSRWARQAIRISGERRHLDLTNHPAASDESSPIEIDLRSELTRALRATAVVIIARDDEFSLPLVVRDLPDVGSVVMVVDNGPSDSTAALARQTECDVVTEPIAGYGRACLAGVQHLEKQFAGDRTTIRYVAFLNGDYRDHPEQIEQLMLPIVNEEAEFVLGSRMMGPRETGAIPIQNVWGIRMACLLMRTIWRTEYTDLGSFRVIVRERLESLSMSDMGSGWTAEMQIKAASAGIPTIEIPVAYRQRMSVNRITGTIFGTVRSGYRILWTIAKFAWLTRKNRSAISKDRFGSSIHRSGKTC